MNSPIPFPHLMEIITSDAETIWINISNIDKISYARQNANWCYVYMKDNQNPIILKNTPDEFYEMVIENYLQLRTKYGL
jgi:hypothetical protein